jgi:hypothetical protein
LVGDQADDKAERVHWNGVVVGDHERHRSAGWRVGRGVVSDIGTIHLRSVRRDVTANITDEVTQTSPAKESWTEICHEAGPVVTGNVTGTSPELLSGYVDDHTTGDTPSATRSMDGVMLVGRSALHPT